MATREVSFREGTNAERLSIDVGQFPQGLIWYTTDTTTFYQVTVDLSGQPQWSVSGGSGLIAPVTQSFSGAGPYTLAAATTDATTAPSGANATLNLPALSGVADGHEVQITLTTAGTVTLAANGSDAIFLGTTTYALAAIGDSVRISKVSNAWRLISKVGAPQNFTVWVSSTGSDTAVGSSAAPLATVAEALRRAGAVQWRSAGTITILNSLSAFPTSVSVPGPIGESGTPLAIVGTQTQLTTGTVNASVAGTSSTPMTVSVSGTPWTANAYSGAVQRFTSGSLNNLSYGVFENTTSTLTTFKFATGTPTNGDTFEILGNPTITSSFTAFQAGTGSKITLQNVNLNMSFISATGVNISTDAVKIIGSVSVDHSSVFSTNVSTYGVIFQSSNPGVSASLVDIPRSVMSRVGFRSAGFQCFRGNMLLSLGVLASGLTRLNLMNSTCSIANLYTSGATVAGGTHFIETVGGVTDISLSSISSIVGGSAFSVTNGRGSMATTTGTGNAAPAVQARSGSQIQVVSPNVGLTIASGGTDVKVGANAAISWATLAAGGNTAITDFATANTEACRIGL